MRTKTVEKLTWVLIYGGLLVLSLGLFLLRSSADMGWALLLAGAAGVVAGVALVVARSRMPDRPDSPEPPAET